MAGFRTVNIETGMPTVNAAVRRLTYEINSSQGGGFTALKIIHGYGSTGAGGKLRVELRRYLDNQKRRGKIKNYIPGETFNIFDADSRSALDACAELRRDGDLGRSNNGITVIIL